jgi:hypothetical protein
MIPDPTFGFPVITECPHSSQGYPPLWETRPDKTADAARKLAGLFR